MTNTLKLKARIIEYGYTLGAFADKIGLSRMSLRQKMNGAIDFKVSEIEKVCGLLNIENNEIATYFFTDGVPKTGTR